MLQWMRKKRGEPVARAPSTPSTELIDFLVDQLPDPEQAKEVTQRAARFRELPAAAQERELPSTYLLVEQHLVEVAGIRLSRPELRGVVVRRHEGLLAQPGFRLIFEPEELQQLFLCRELLATLLERSLEVLDTADGRQARLALEWLPDIPDRAADALPFGVTAPPPHTTDDWIRLLTAITHALHERVERILGRQAAQRMFESGYDELAERYLGLPTFSAVIGLLPEKLLDERKIRELDHGQMQQVVMDKVDHLQRANRRLSENNVQLEQAQKALEKANEELEARVRDRTEALHLVNEDLRESEEKLRLITAAAYDAIVMLDDLGRVSFWNSAAERVFGYPKSEMLGQDICRPLVPGRYHSRFRRALRVFSKTGRGLGVGETVEWNALGHDRDEFPVELSVSAVKIQDRWHALAVVRDITDRKEAEEERRHLEERMQENQRLESLGLLAGGIAHDFNNLLSTILGNAGLARRQADSGDGLSGHLVDIETAVSRAADLTQQMLAYSGRGQFVIEAFELSDVVEEMAQLLRVSIAKGAELDCEMGGDLPAIEADRSQVQQVVMNLITNASDALEDGAGSIVARTGALRADGEYLSGCELGAELEPGDYVFVEVTDDGCGMDAETRAKIFDPFFSTKFVGRGLGLAAVLGIVRGHQGAMRVDSEPGEGTTFRVLFPASASVVPRDEAPAETGELGDFQGTGTVLVVDDEPAVRGMVASALGILGFEVLDAEDGEQAIEMFSEKGGEIDLVLMDLSMPRMGGKEAFRKIRELRADARVILSSGYSRQDALREMVGEKPMGFLQKPYDLTTLAAEVRAALER
ncbi:MAG: response regulator [bacterium]|nr:response regulator [bacterium]